MKQLLKRTIASLTLAVGFTTAVRAATPVAVFEGGDLNGGTVSDFALTLNGNTYEAGAITIADAAKGVQISVPGTDKQIVSVLVRYSGLDQSAISGNPAVVSICQGKTGSGATEEEYKDVGVFANTSKFSGFYNNVGDYGPLNYGTAPATGFFLLSYSANPGDGDGVAAYIGTKGSGGSWTWSGRIGNSSLRFTGNMRYVSKIAVGGPNASTAHLPFTGLKIEGVAIFASRISTADVESFAWPKCERFTYAPTYTWKTPTSVLLFHNGTYLPFDTATGSDVQGGTSPVWQTFASNQTQYQVPGAIMRYIGGDYNKQSDAQFTPMTFGGMFVECGAMGYSLKSDGNRVTELGDKTGTVPTWFVYNEDYTFNRQGLFTLYGDISFDVAAGKVVDLNSARTGQQTVLDPDSSATLRMHGDGSVKVHNLKALGAVSLDYSNLVKNRETPYITGNLTCDVGTKFVFPADLAADESFALCSGTVTGVDGIHEITVGEETFFARLTVVGNAVSYAKVSANTATVTGNTTWSELSSEFIDGLPAELTLTADAEIRFVDETVTLPGLTLKGGFAATLVYVVTPTITEIKTEGETTYAIKLPSNGDRDKGAALTVPVGETYIIAGGEEEVVVWSGLITVNGTLKTEGLLNFSNGANAVAAGGTLEVVSGGLTFNGGDRKVAGTLTVDADATLVSARNDLLNYAGTPTLNVGGALDFAATRWTLGKGNNYTAVTLADGAVVRGSGDAVGALHLNANGTYNVTGDATVSAPTAVSSDPTITVAAGKTLDFTGRVYPYQAATRTITLNGEGTIKFSAGYVTNLCVNAGSGMFVFAGDELVLNAGSEGSVTVADGSTLKLCVTVAQMVTGYEATSVTLAAGRNITFVTPTGREIVGQGNALPSQTMTWTGAAGDTLWATAGNWSENTVPTAEIPVRFTGDAVVTVAEGDTAAGLVIDTELTLTNATAFAFTNVVSGAGKLVKAGAGVLTLGGANTLADGIDIVEGTVRLNSDMALGTGPTDVKAGATIDMNGKKPLNEIFLAGDGVDGNGALVTDVNMASSIGTKIRLTANASWGGSAYYHFGANSDVQLRGFTFTKRGTNRFPVYNTTIDGPGKIVVAEGAFENNNGVNHLEDIDFEVLAGAELDMSKGTSLAVSNFVCRGTIVGAAATLKVGGALTVETDSAFRPANRIECREVEMGAGAVFGLNAASQRGFTVLGAGTVDVSLTAAEFEAGRAAVFTPGEGATTKLGTVTYDGKTYCVKSDGGTITRIFKTGVMFFVR